jgi:2'-phosphotransferase
MLTEGEGMRVSSQILIFIDFAAAMAAGILFYMSTNGVILTTGDGSGLIPVEYFSSVERRVDTGWEPLLFSTEATETTPPEATS